MSMDDLKEHDVRLALACLAAVREEVGLDKTMVGMMVAIRRHMDTSNPERRRDLEILARRYAALLGDNTDSGEGLQ